MIVLSWLAIDAGSSQSCTHVSESAQANHHSARRRGHARVSDSAGDSTHLALGAREPPQRRECRRFGQHLVPRLGDGLLGRQVLAAERRLDVSQNRPGLGKDVRLVAEARGHFDWSVSDQSS